MLENNYHRLSIALNNTRKSLRQVCHELDINIDLIDIHQLPIDQCSHCNRWSLLLIEDLDGNPICRFCEELVGL